MDNVKNNRIIDGTKIKHGVITARKIYDLSDWIDPETHLNLDFRDHLVTRAYVAQRLERGAEMILDDKGLFTYALNTPNAYKHYGRVDVDERMQEVRASYTSQQKKKEKQAMRPIKTEM
jgi:hypothetical protein